jgi:hypothetical protein
VKLKNRIFCFWALAAALVFSGRPLLAQEEEDTDEESAEAEEETEAEEGEGAEAEAEEGGEEAAETGEEEGEEGEEAGAEIEDEAGPEEEEAGEPEEVETPAPTETVEGAGGGAEPEAAAEAEGVLAPAGAEGGVDLEADVKPAKRSPFRNSYFLYENTFSAYSLKKDAQLTYNPYYAMSYSFRPRYYVWKDLYVGLRWDLEQELTDADATTKYRQVIWSDVLLDLAWTTAYTIPTVDIIFTPKIRVELPASLQSQARTLYLSLGPGFNLTRIFDVWGGIVLQYAFRYTKYFNKYTSTLSEEPLLECPEKGACRYDVIGPQNPSMRVTNDFYLEIRPTTKFFIDALVEVRNYILYPVPDAEYETVTGTETVGSSGKRHSGYMWYIFELGYDILPFFTVAVGSSTYNPMLNPESEYYPPFFNRYTNLYLDFAIDLDGAINAIIKGKRGKRTEEDRLEELM